ncbi:MAG: NUDIX hydrolase [Bacilli bacterium]|jgi:8-oxo-dGTP pyrophosphatase MutT (NUDIX family)|nr:NUDIX hydrolase [Bacilli bacterium]
MIKTEKPLPIDLKDKKLNLFLEDLSWPKASSYQDRLIARAVVFDGYDLFFAHVHRDDIFGKMDFLETSGGGVKEGESLIQGLKRELREELGFEVEVVAELGQVTDFYNLIGRRNLNHYFLARKIKEVPPSLMEDEKNQFHLTLAKVSYEEALEVYKKNKDEKLGRLLYNREVPVIELAEAVIKSYGLM